MHNMCILSQITPCLTDVNIMDHSCSLNFISFLYKFYFDYTNSYETTSLKILWPGHTYYYVYIWCLLCSYDELLVGAPLYSYTTGTLECLDCGRVHVYKNNATVSKYTQMLSLNYIFNNGKICSFYLLLSYLHAYTSFVVFIMLPS